MNLARRTWSSGVGAEIAAAAHGFLPISSDVAAVFDASGAEEMFLPVLSMADDAFAGAGVAFSY